MKKEPSLNDPDEDYAESVCLLLPKGRATLVDTDFFEWAAHLDWKVLGRVIYHTEYVRGVKVASRRRSKMYLHHEAVMFGLSMVASWNLRNAMARGHIDHKNRNPWDNRRKNLRPATPSQNCANRAGKPGSSSKFKGVSKARGKNRWRAQVMIRGKRYWLGTYDSELAAAMAYNRFVAARLGEFAYLNPITIRGDGN